MCRRTGSCARHLVGLGLGIRLGAGATVIREFLAADLVDHLHLVAEPTVVAIVALIQPRPSTRQA